MAKAPTILYDGGSDAYQCHNIGTVQKVSISGTSAQSAAVNSKTTAVMVVADTDCTITIGNDPTAVVANHVPLVADTYIVLGIKPGDKVAVIGTSGILTIIENNYFD